ncbi:MAG: cytochrome c family protein [Acidobacteriota bacterium]|nr:cytochrome c3 family protein [Blastocatellia bacterium]MDQ3219483.1 cytochrome c family protein [Acidobacteriota bacterium]MDQ3489480.1 cytochrome c family protein [Acidobacteriota bacterium]
MKNFAKLFMIGVFALTAAALFISSAGFSRIGQGVLAQTSPTPPVSNTAANANIAKPAGKDKTFPKEFTLGKNSLSEYGEVAFNHDSHAFKQYSPDGKSAVGCTECHHTDQPKAALKPPLVTSERTVALTLESWKQSDQKVNECRSCHFQDGSVPDGKVMPSASYTDAGKTTKKELNNELAYHINCNTCHDAAAKLRPELIKKTGFATAKDCTICHKAN